MPGMMTEAQNTPPPSSGPVSQTPPPASPSAGVSSGAGAAGPGQPDIETLKDAATQLVYGERFDQLITMFQTNGAEKFPRSMGIAVNTAISELEKQFGPIGPELAAEVGMDLMMKLMEDVITGKVLPDVSLEQTQEALPAILMMYADSHPEVSKEDVQQLVMEIENGVKQAKGGDQQPEGNSQPPPGEVPASLPQEAAPPMGAM